ncbi:MAG TPA: sugar phosphate isomerase/epimerase family protein [Terriglobia bacterium]|nr:sugar phosphate isomerase/epimerase family protein [Terriglobia bacterium]
MKLAAFPKCYMDQLVVERSMSLFDWIAMSADLGVDGLELYDGFLESTEPAYLERVRSEIEGRGLTMPMLCYSPDFTQPGAEERRREIEREKRAIDVTAALGGRFCRVLSGQRRPKVSRQQGVTWVVESIRELLGYAAEKNIVLAIENHYKDNYWKHPEFAQKSEVYLEILNRLESPWFGAQYDPSNAILAGEDPIELLEQVKHRVVTMHASDRFLKPGHTLDELRAVEDSVGYAAILSHGVVGKGLNDYPRIFRILREVGYQGWISIEDGMNGLEEIRQSAEFLRSMIAAKN